MKYLDILRQKHAAVAEQRAAALDAIEAIATTALAESRSMSADDDATVAAHTADVTRFDAELGELGEQIAKYEAIEARTAEIAKRPQLQVITKPAPSDVLVDRAASPQQLADALTRSIEHRVDSADNMDHVRKLVMRHRSDRDWARALILRSSEAYESAWAKVMFGRHHDLTAEERTALSSTTAANGGYLVPTHLDPTVILTNNGSANVLRQHARIVTLTRPGDNSWQGITSAGVTASFDGEVVEVSDDSPTFGQPSVPTYQAQALVQASIAAAEDIPGLAGEILMMFGDAKDRLEGAEHMTGAGTSGPTGLFTALDANTNVEIVSDTAAAIYKADLNEVYTSVPVRFRRNAKWVMHPTWALAIQDLGTAVSNSFSSTIVDGPTDLLYRKPVVESDDAPSTTTTTVRDNRLVFGDLSNYVIVDKPGSFSVEYIPHLFSTTTNLPDGRRGWYAHWRNGGDSTNDLAFRLLQDKTSA